jgi:ppGpp synthetase/RelA/SpoT-type nucleotidyltranferase
MDAAASFSGGAIDRLGDRLRESSDASEEDLRILQELRRQFDAAMEGARLRIVESIPDARPTTRLKTIQTLIGKLRREPAMKLSRVQDVAGMRLVSDMSLEQQDVLGSRLSELFGGARVVDRRANPSFGYRALHLVVRSEGRLVEIQVRTRLQDRWAQIVERMADHWGRGIRYGELPEKPTARVSRYTRAEVVDLARRMSPLIEQCERNVGVQGNRIQLSSDRFCLSVAELLSMFARLRINPEEK